MTLKFTQRIHLVEPYSWSSTLMSSVTWVACRRNPPPELTIYQFCLVESFNIFEITFTAGSPDLMGIVIPMPTNDLCSIISFCLFYIENLLSEKKNNKQTRRWSFIRWWIFTRLSNLMEFSYIKIYKTSSTYQSIESTGDHITFAMYESFQRNESNEKWTSRVKNDFYEQLTHL